MKAALGNPGPQRTEAVDSIANYMQYFLASDVLYGLAQAQIDSVLDRPGHQRERARQRLHDRPPALARLARGLDRPRRRVRRQGQQRHSWARPAADDVRPGNVTLDPDAPATISGGGTPEVDVQVQNQGSADESDVGVSFQLTGGTQTITGSGTIPRLAAGTIQTVSIPIDPEPEKDQQLTLEVTVQPVPGEQLTNNNRFTYTRHLPLAGVAARGSHHNPAHARSRRIPRSRRHLLRGCPPRRRRRRGDRPADRPPPSTRRFALSARARSIAPWSRSRTRSRDRSARPSTRSPSRASR